MNSTPIQISHNRLIQLQLIEEQQHPNFNLNSIRYFIFEVNDNRWQNTNPNGETEYDLQSIRQEPALLPIGILSVDKNSHTFSFEGDLTVTQEDQEIIFENLSK